MNAGFNFKDNKPGRRKFAFLCYSSDFFVSHFRPVLSAARVQGFELFAFLPSTPEGTDEILREVTVVPIGTRRTRFPLFWLLPNFFSTVSILRQYRPDVVQAFSLHACIILALSSIFVSINRKVFTITGLGLIDIDPGWLNRLLRPAVYALIRLAGASGATWFVFENATDSIRLGFRSGHPIRKLILMGAGVDHLIYTPQPLPTLPPLKVAVVSRMIWSKGIDLAVRAVSRLIVKGVPVELHLYGRADRQNPRHFSDALLNEWAARDGIRWHGHVTDIPGIWRQHHVGLFPSRGGEGLPRSLLEAAACGRAVIVTAVPGCTDFVRPGIEGLVVEENSVEELEVAIESLLAQPEQLVTMGEAARHRVMETATEEIVTAQYRRLFAEL